MKLISFYFLAGLKFIVDVSKINSKLRNKRVSFQFQKANHSEKRALVPVNKALYSSYFKKSTLLKVRINCKSYCIPRKGSCGAWVAQSAVHSAVNRRVLGSIPSLGGIFLKFFHCVNENRQIRKGRM